jgi:hypothetical protein
MNAAMRRKSNDPQKSLEFAKRRYNKKVQKRERYNFIREVLKR